MQAPVRSATRGYSLLIPEANAAAACSTLRDFNPATIEVRLTVSITKGLHAENYHRWRARPANGSVMVSVPHSHCREPSSHTLLVLPLANSPGGHRLGINGLAVDIHRSILLGNTSPRVLSAIADRLTAIRGVEMV